MYACLAESAFNSGRKTKSDTNKFSLLGLCQCPVLHLLTKNNAIQSSSIWGCFWLLKAFCFRFNCVLHHLFIDLFTFAPNALNTTNCNLKPKRKFCSSKKNGLKPLEDVSILAYVSSRMWRVVPKARPAGLWIGISTAGALAVCDAVWHRKRSGGEERSVQALPRGGGLPPHTTQSISEKCRANHIPQRGPQVWPWPHRSLGALGLDAT